MDLAFYGNLFVWVFMIAIPLIATGFAATILTLLIWGAFAICHIAFTETRARVAMLISVLFFAPMGVGIFKQIYNVESEKVERTKVLDDVVVERFTLVEFDPPKHVYVSLKHKNSGATYSKLYVSKHCGTYPKLNEEYNVKIQKWHYANDPDVKYWDFQNMSNTFCGA